MGAHMFRSSLTPSLPVQGPLDGASVARYLTSVRDGVTL